MSTKFNNLTDKVPIVDPGTGNPSEFFIRLLQKRGGILSSVEDLVDGIAAEHIIAGAGLDGGGLIGDLADITLDVNIQETLDLLSAAAGHMAYRDVANWVAVAFGTGLRFDTPGTIRFCGAVPQTTSGTSYTAVLGDADGYRRFTSSSAIAYTIPKAASVAFPLGTVLTFAQKGAGQVTLTPDTGVTIDSFGGALKTAGQHAVAQVKLETANQWTAIGNLTT